MAYGENAACGSSLGTSDYYAKEAQQQIQAQRGALVGGEPKRQPELPSQLAGLGQAMDFVAKELEQLEMRLQPVLRPQPPPDQTNKTDSAGRYISGAEPHSTYAHVVHEQTQRAHRYAEGLHRLAERLEV